MRLAVLVVVMVAGATVSAAISARPISPSAYLAEALSLIRAHDVVSPAVDWPLVTRRARAMARDAKTSADTYGAIEHAIEAVNAAGDLHARLLNPLTAKLARTAPDVTATPPPWVSLVDGRLGEIQLQGVSSKPTSPNGRRYAAVALTAVARMERTSRPCGWIVDLQPDGGGDIFPMLLAVGPILGEGRLGGFTGRHGYLDSVDYRTNTVSEGRYTARAPVLVSPIAPAPPVAVIYGPETASAGEFVAIAFRGRSQTRSFGTPTAGFITAPQLFPLADGAELSLGTSYFTDRDRNVYRHPVDPDVRSGTPDTAAAHWLLAQPACAH